MTQGISQTIKLDHVAIKAIYDEIIHATNNKKKVEFQNLFTWELARHLVGKELVLFPAIEKDLPEGKSSAEIHRQEHHKIKEKLKDFQTMKPDDPNFLPSIHALMADFSQQMEAEEATDLVALENSISPHESQRLSKSFARTKFFAPTRSHPGAPSKPPFETAVGLLTAPFDHLTDMFRKWPDAPSTSS